MILSQIYVSSQFDEPNYFVTKETSKGVVLLPVNSPLCYLLLYEILQRCRLELVMAGLRAYT